MTNEGISAESATPVDNADTLTWFVMRDLKRPNAKLPAYKELSEMGYEVFTPMKWVISRTGGRTKRLRIPALADLLFVHSSRDMLASALESIPTVQYRYVRGGYCKPMVVGDKEMENFIKATNAADTAIYYTPSEIDQMSVGRSVEILGGPMAGVSGRILKVRGARRKRVVVELPGFIAAVMEVEGEYLRFID